MRRIKLARSLMKVADVLPHPYPIQSKPGLTHQPFFIFGSGRNGSTLLNRILNQHSMLFLPSEQYFLGNSIIKFRLYNWIIWRDLVKIITGELIPASNSHTWDFDAGPILIDLFGTSDRSLQNLIDTIFRGYGESMGKTAFKWGDTTPMNTRYIPEIWKTFPHAKYCFLIRDGRDVVTSYTKAGKDYLGDLAIPENSVKHWKKSLRSYEWLAKRTEVLMIRYEDLVNKPKESLQEICEHLEIDFSDKMLFHEQNPPNEVMYQEPQHEKIFKPLDSNSIGRWRYNLDAEEQKVFAEIASDLLKYGYK